MPEDPYYTYTDYLPCKPATHKVCWIVPVLVLVALLSLCGGRFLLPLLASLQGGL